MLKGQCNYLVYVYGLAGQQWQQLFTRQWVSYSDIGDTMVALLREWSYLNSPKKWIPAFAFQLSGTQQLYVYAWKDCGDGKGWVQISP